MLAALCSRFPAGLGTCRAITPRYRSSTWPYFTEGLRQGEQVVTICDAEKIAGHKRALRERIPLALDEAMRTDQFRIFASEETYLSDRCFSHERMCLLLEDVLKAAEAGPFKRVRTCGDMTCALREMPGTDELMEYESRVNTFTKDHDCTLMCVYGGNRFSGRAVMDVLAIHPMVVMGDRIYENPYYVEPTVYLQNCGAVHLHWPGQASGNQGEHGSAPILAGPRTSRSIRSYRGLHICASGIPYVGLTKIS